MLKVLLVITYTTFVNGVAVSPPFMHVEDDIYSSMHECVDAMADEIKGEDLFETIGQKMVIIEPKCITATDFLTK